MKKNLISVFFLIIPILFFACGGSSRDQAAASPGDKPTKASVENQGVLLAKEILSLFDELVGKVADLSQDKPDAAMLKPKLTELYQEYQIRMEGLNLRYLSLRGSDKVHFGECNRHLGENRGSHVFKKDQRLGPSISHYNFQLGDQEMVKLLSVRPVELLDLAIQTN
jgi:hypothetical protein